jgi:hypothetical protein
MLRQRYGTRVSSKQARAFCTRQKLLGQTALISARTRQQARRHCGSLAAPSRQSAACRSRHRHHRRRRARWLAGIARGIATAGRRRVFIGAASSTSRLARPPAMQTEQAAAASTLAADPIADQTTSSSSSSSSSRRRRDRDRRRRRRGSGGARRKAVASRSAGCTGLAVTLSQTQSRTTQHIGGTPPRAARDES